MMKRLVVLAVLAAVVAGPLVGRALAQEKAGGAAAPAAAAAPAGGEAGSSKDELKENQAHGTGGLFEIIFRAGWFGGMIWLLLLISSVASVALIVDSYLTIREIRITPPALVEAVRAAINEGDLLKAIQQCDANPGPLSSILQAGFSNAQEGYEVIQDSVSVAADLESEKMLQRVTYLSVISNITPMLGLIGTVQGMIMAFASLATMAAGAAQQAMLAMNISHGLWATAVGLGTSVPATIFFFFFKNKAMRHILRMEALTLDLIKALRNVEVVEG